MIRKHKIYSRPKRPFDKARIEEEGKIIEEFGLKNKKEMWKAEARIKEIREKAKKLISAEPSEQKKLFERLGKIGFKVNSIGNILSLDKTDYLKRRLQTILVNKKLARAPKSARQLIVHKKVIVGGKAVDSPSYIVPVEFENEIVLKVKRAKPKENVKVREETENEESA